MPWVLRITLTFLPALLLAYFYSGWKLYHALIKIFTWPKEQIKWFIIAGLGYLNLHPFLMFGGYVLGLERFTRSTRVSLKLWDIFFTYPFWFGLILVAEVLPWLVALDLIKLPFFPFFKKYKITWLEIQSRIVLVMMLFFTVYILIRIYIDTNRVQVTKIELTVANLSPSLNGLRIVHISDVQVDQRTHGRKMNRYIKKVNKLQPDIIFFTGDLVTSGTKYIELGAQVLGTLEAKYGVYACLGDHDYWADPLKVADSLKRHYIQILEDMNHFIRAGPDSILVTAITNVYSRRPKLDHLNMLMGSQPRGSIDVVISHQPSESLIEIAADRGYHLFLAGHTHGGQIVLRPFGFPLTPTRLESPYFKGVHRIDGMMVSINNGLGLTFAPFRYQAPAEVTLIKLVGK